MSLLTPEPAQSISAATDASDRHPLRWIMRSVITVILVASGYLVWQDHPDQAPTLPPTSSGDFIIHMTFGLARVRRIRLRMPNFTRQALH